MTNDRMGRGYFEQAVDWHSNLESFLKGGRWASAVRHAQECTELLLKAALRLVGIEPAHTHDVSGALRDAARRFPEGFSTEVATLAEVSQRLAEWRGPSFHGDEQACIPPQEMFDEEKARWACRGATLALGLTRRLLEEVERAQADPDREDRGSAAGPA